MNLRYFLHHPKDIVFGILYRIAKFIPDERYVKWIYYLNLGRELNLKNPQTYNEKLQWLKLYYRRPEYTMMVDKYSVKDLVARTIGDQYVIPTIGVWESFDEIDFSKLPNRFVLKTTHGGGGCGVVVCRDKNSFDVESAKKKLNHSMSENDYARTREWPYKNVRRRIIAEEFVEGSDDANDLPDYKFFCFDGEVKALFVGTERGTGDVKFDYYDAEYNHLDLVQYHPMSAHPLPKPQCFELMKELAAKLSKGIPHVRVDLYESKGKVYFGELTFYHHGGIVPFHPESWDYTFGSWLTLPTIKIVDK